MSTPQNGIHDDRRDNDRVNLNFQGTRRISVDASGASVNGTFSTSGALTVTAGGLLVTAGGVTVTADNVAMVAGTLDLQDGGTVIQAGSKSTGVSLSTHSGQITMNNASLVAGTEVTFTVTNTKVSATDVVIVNHGSAGAAGSYLVVVSAIAAGSFKITVGNLSGGDLGEAIVLNFAVIKGASS